MGSKASWNTDRARVLFDAGVPLDQIAGRLGVSRTMLAAYARNHHWPSRPAMALKGPHEPTKPRDSGRARMVKPGASTLPPLASLED